MKKLVSIAVVLAVLFLFAGCTAPNNSTGAVSGPDHMVGSEALPADGYYPVTVIDQAGRKVEIDKPPRRLISSYYITTSLLMALELDDRLVGVEDNADLRPVYGLSNPDILGLPAIGTAKQLDLEAVAALMPDLAILPMKVKDSVDALEALGIPVLLVDPESQQKLIEMIGLVADATNTQQKAEELIGFVEAQEQRLAELLAGVEMPDVYLAGNSDFLTTAGNAMYQSDMIRLAGGRNVAEKINDSYWAQIDYEQLLVWDPDYIILPSSAKYTAADVLADPNLADCRAVANGNVYQVPGDAEAWDSPVPGSILGAFWLASILHPQRITDTDAAAIMNEYYETFYHFAYRQN